MASFQKRQFERLCVQLRSGEVKEVHVSNLRYGPLTEEMLEKILDPTLAVEGLHFNIPLSRSMLMRLVPWLEETMQLKTLGFEYCDESMIEFFRALSPTHLAVTRLELCFYENFCLLLDKGSVVQDFFARNQSITHLKFEVREEMGLWEARQQVTLLECLLMGLSKNACLKHLELILSTGSDLSEESMGALFASNSTLRSLTVTGLDRIQEPFLTDFLTALESGCASRGIGLHCLTHDAFYALCRRLSSSSKMCSLTMTGFPFPPPALELLCESITRNCFLQSLALDSPVYSTIKALGPALKKHVCLYAIDLLGNQEAGSIFQCVEDILESNSRITEFGLPVDSQQDALEMIRMIPRLHHVRNLKIVVSASSDVVIDEAALLDALRENTSLLHFDCVCPFGAEIQSCLHDILRRNAALKRRRLMMQSIEWLEMSPPTWPLILADMARRETWIDTKYCLCRELVLLRQLS